MDVSSLAVAFSMNIFMALYWKWNNQQIRCDYDLIYGYKNPCLCLQFKCICIVILAAQTENPIISKTFLAVDQMKCEANVISDSIPKSNYGAFLPNSQDIPFLFAHNVAIMGFLKL